MPEGEPEFNASKPPAHSLGFLLPRVAHSLDRDFEQMLAGFEIRSTHLGVLSTLRAYEPLSQRQVANYLGLERQTMVNIVDDLERRKLVQRGNSPTDRRVQLLQLTAEGRIFQERVDQAAEQHEQQVFGVLSAAEQETLAELLLKLSRVGYFEALLAPPNPD